jgi:hypothetical protein
MRSSTCTASPAHVPSTCCMLSMRLTCPMW